MFSVGIDIGTSSVKLAEITIGSKSHRLTRYTEFPLKLDPNYDPKIEILDILRQIAEHYESMEAQFVVGIKQQNVILRPIEFPFRERHKIQKSLPFELEDDLPISQADCVFDFKAIRYQGTGVKGLGVVTLTNRVAALLGQVQEAGIDPSLVSVEGLAYANFFEAWDDIPSP